VAVWWSGVTLADSGEVCMYSTFVGPDHLEVWPSHPLRLSIPKTDPLSHIELSVYIWKRIKTISDAPGSGQRSRATCMVSLQNAAAIQNEQDMSVSWVPGQSTR